MESNVGILTLFNNCRICLQIHQEMTPIQFLKESNDHNFLLTYFNIEVAADFRYPNKICAICLNQLNNTILLKQKCESTFNNIKSILNDNIIQVLPFQVLNVLGEPIKTEKSDEIDIKGDNGVEDNSQATLLENIKPEKSDNVTFACKLCNFTCQVCNCISNHMKSEHNVCEGGNNLNLPVNTKIKKRFKCEHCEKTFIKLSHKLRHEATHQKKIFKCDQCPRTFRNEDVLTRHIRIHLGQKPFPCNECSRSFSVRRALTIHKLTHHSDNPPPKAICKECGKAVRNLSAHNIHKHSPHQFECKYCKKKFAFKSGLATHVKHFHENCEESFTVLCILCGKVFRRMSELNAHNKAKHSDERNYLCQYCDKRFKSSSARAKHVKSHLNDRRFKCTYCSRAFTLKRTLIGHIRTHTGERPYSCNICSKTFTQNATLGTHYKLVHGRAVTHKK